MHLLKVLKLTPNHDKSLYNLAKILIQENDYAKSQDSPKEGYIIK